MQRRDFLRSSGVLSLAAGVGLTGEIAWAQSESSVAFGLNGAPVVGHTTGTSAIITFAVTGPSTAWVEFGETPELGTTVAPSSGGLRPYESLVQRVQLTGLKPGTCYYYRVSARAVNFKNAYDIKPGETVTSGVASFTTLNPKADKASFVVWNDTHDNRETLTTLHGQTRQLAPDFLFINGDVSNDITTEEKTVSLFLNPYGLPFAQQYPLLFCRGNHDVRGRAARHLPNYVSVPDNTFYYSFRHGPLGALVLDTGEDKPDDHPVYGGLNDFAAFRTEQQRWLEQEIRKPHFREAPFRVLFCHIPLWWKDETSKGSFCLDGREKWHDLLVKARIHLVISGHTHNAFHLPPSERHPYHQFVGGGPQPGAATIISAQVERKRMLVSMKNLTGQELAKVELKV